MTHLCSKNELTFSITWIISYVVLFSLADNISANSGTAKIITAPLSVIMAALLLAWIAKNGLSEKYGLQKVKIDYGKYLYFLPLIAIATNIIAHSVFHSLSAFAGERTDLFPTCHYLASHPPSTASVNPCT